MALDLIAASEGTPDSRQGNVLVAAFPTFHTAILAARRLQWAIQGFTETEEVPSTTLALLIHTPEEVTGKKGNGLTHSLNQASSGQILLTDKASRSFDNLPGFPMQKVAGSALKELLWRCPENQSTRLYDEEILNRLAEEQAAQSPVPGEPPAPHAGVQAAAGAEFMEQLRSEPLQMKSNWKMGALAAAALVLAVVAYFYFSGGKSNSSLASDQSQSQTAVTATPASDAQTAQSSQASQSRTAHTAAQDRAEAQAAAKAARNAPKNDAKPPEPQAQKEEKPPAPKAAEPPPARGGRCDLDSSQFAGQIDQALKNLGRGRYADAKRQFSAVLACDPGNSRAREGMERARLASSDSGDN